MPKIPIDIESQIHNDGESYPQLPRIAGYVFNQSADFETVRMMKEKLCYVAYNVEQEQKLGLETTYLVEPYTLPGEFPLYSPANR